MPWSVSAAWNWTLLARARASASCKVNVKGACEEPGGVSCARMHIGKEQESINPARKVLVDKEGLLTRASSIRKRDAPTREMRKASAISHGLILICPSWAKSVEILVIILIHSLRV